MSTLGKDTWILVANRARALVYEASRTKRPTRVLDIENPRGRLKAGDINSDKSGRAFPRHGTGSSDLEKAHDPVEHEAETFAKHLATTLEEALHARRFDELVLIAEPHFLGLLRGAIGSGVSARIAGSFAKDLAAEPDVELERSLMPLIA